MVSIHASVKDATEAVDVDFSVVVVSIHASVKDATAGFSQVDIAELFQSTHL